MLYFIFHLRKTSLLFRDAVAKPSRLLHGGFICQGFFIYPWLNQGFLLSLKAINKKGAPFFARPHLFCKRFLSFWSQFRCFFYFKNRMIRQSNSLSQYKKHLFSFLSSLYSFWPSSIPNSIRSTTCVTSSVPFFRYVSLGRFCRLRRLLLPRCQYP